MKALILAAGKGERLEAERAKVLERFLGLPIVERVILSAREAGVKEFCVVLGYQGEHVAATLGDGSRLGVNIRYIWNKRWGRENGYSVLAAKEALEGERFFLLMGDHLFDSKILARLAGVKVIDGCVLCADKKLQAVFDLPEATKVQTEKGEVRAIGKKLEKFDAVDCGIFLCTDEIFNAVEKSIAKGRDELSQAIELLAKRGKVKSFDVGDAFWFDLDTPQDFREARRRMLKSLARPSDGPISRHLNRKLSSRISGFLVESRVPPNVLSFAAFLMGACAALLFGLGSYLSVAAGGVLAQICSIFDGCDGEVARLKFSRSSFGALLDSTLDRYADILLVLGLVYGYWRMSGGEFVLFVGFAALIGSFMISYSRARYEGAFGSTPSSQIPASRDVRLFILMVGALLNQVLVTLAILAILTNGEVIRRMVCWSRGQRQS